MLLAGALGAGAAALASGNVAHAPRLEPWGIGVVRFGAAKAKAVAELGAQLGIPSARSVNTGCGPRFSEVAWGDLVVEFRDSRFSGYRYLRGGWPLTTRGSPRTSSPSKPVSPRLSTATGISLGSTLSQLRASYGKPRRVGADMWRSSNGLIFVDDALRDPVPPSSRIIEIKIGTCGAF
jgi:hypothetical protein